MPDRPAYLCCLAHKGQKIGLRTGRYKYVTTLGGPDAVEELYDTREDPGETEDLGKLYPGLLARLREQAMAIASKHSTHTDRDRAFEAPSPEHIKQLRALGYIE